VDGRLVAALAVAALLLYTLRFGYAFGSGDQDELVPTALSLLDGRLFTRDWLVQAVRDGVNVRTYFLWLMAAPGTLVPLAWSTAALHAAVWLATAAGVHALALEISRDRLAAALGTLLATTGTVFFAIGSNAILSNALLPEGVAWALALPGTVLFLRGRWAAAGALLGAAAWFHLLAGGLVALVLGLAGLTARGADGRRPWSGLLRFGGVCVLVALPILVPVALDQAGAAADPTGPAPLFIHAVYRNPWHHLFFSFAPGLQVRFWTLMAAGVAGLLWLRRRERIAHGALIGRIWAVSAALWLVAVLFVEVWPVETVAKLQLFKTAVLAALLASLVAAAVAARLIPEALRSRLAPLAARPGGALVGVAALGLLGLGAGVHGVGPYAARIEPARHAESDLGAVERWARGATPVDALFAIPPRASTFRSGARRAVVADWNGFVFGDAAMQTWYARLKAVAPAPPVPRGTDPRPALDAAYRANDAAAWRALQREFGVDYVVVERGSLPFPEAFRAGPWTVYSLPTAP
jgi:hypothetical protein